MMFLVLANSGQICTEINRPLSLAGVASIMKVRARTAHYGFDAPGIMIGMLAGGAAGLGLSAAGMIWTDGAVWVSAAILGLVALVPVVLGLSMLVYGRVGKKRMRDYMIGLIDWRGDEQVLDIGAGLGLLLIGAAKKLRARGRATAVDIWRTEDLSGGGLEQLAANVAIEGVEDRVAILTEDARTLSIADGSIDVVLSLFCIHNIEGEAEQKRALLEIVRVLKPGGRVLIGEWMPIARYAEVFAAAGLKIRSQRSHIATALSPMWMVDAEKPVPSRS
ncbi:MAG: class I SAM-dependent methyltransferase [Beijerinckiaceae bacterium]|nr:class I SAM-dependent methyltransferase [Beijerinckiaceae bacterium]